MFLTRAFMAFLPVLVLACESLSSEPVLYLEEIAAKNGETTVALPPYAPLWLEKILENSVEYWNRRAGSDLFVISPYREATVKVNYRYTNSIQEIVSLRGSNDCTGRKGDNGPCEPLILIPAENMVEEEIYTMIPTTIQSDLDKLIEKRAPTGRDDTIVEKVALLNTLHELGHVIGLANRKQERCLMNSSLYGNKALCEDLESPDAKPQRSMYKPNWQKYTY